MEKRISVVPLAIIFNADGKILLSLRNDPELKKAHMKWEFPGGTVEFGESLEDTLHREVREETGLAIEIMQMIPRSLNWQCEQENFKNHVLLFCFVCKRNGGSLTLASSDEVKKFIWVTPKKALEYNLLPLNEKFIHYILDNHIAP